MIRSRAALSFLMRRLGGQRALWLAAALAPVVALVLPRAERAPGPLLRAAREFVAGLDDAARATAILPFDDAERQRWAFVPGQYPGVPLAALDLASRRRLHAVLRAALSETGYQTVSWIQRLELVLREAESKPDAPALHRDPERYALACFGDPRSESRFGLRFQGHHVSLNFLVVDGELVAGTPLFLGSNPHELRDGPFAGTRVLGRQDDLARALLASLDEEQRQRTMLAGEVPADIVLAPGRAADLLGAPRGIPRAALNEAQRAPFDALLEAFVDLLQPAHAARELARIRSAGLDAVHFAWLGSDAVGAPQYWRLHGPGFAIEWCNIQNGANHVHTVWNDLSNGFGVDVLREHLSGERR